MRKNRAEKYRKKVKNWWLKFYKNNERYQTIDSRRLKILSQMNTKYVHIQTSSFQTAEFKNKRQSWSQPELGMGEGAQYYIQKNKEKNGSKLLLRNCATQKLMEWLILITQKRKERKPPQQKQQKLSNQNSLTSENNFTKWRWHKDFFLQSLRKFTAIADTIWEMLKETLQAEGIWIQIEKWIFTKKFWAPDMVKMKHKH